MDLCPAAHFAEAGATMMPPYHNSFGGIRTTPRCKSLVKKTFLFSMLAPTQRCAWDRSKRNTHPFEIYLSDQRAH